MLSKEAQEEDIEMQIVRMATQGIVNAARQNRLMIMQLDQLEIAGKNDNERDEVTNHVLKKYIRPLAVKMEFYFSMFALFPFKFVTVKIRIKQKEYQVLVPKEYAVGTFRIIVDIDEYGDKRTRVFKKGIFMNEEVEHVIFSIRAYEGKSLDGKSIHSECGSILEDWKTYCIRQESITRTAWQRANPKMLLKKQKDGGGPGGASLNRILEPQMVIPDRNTEEMLKNSGLPIDRLIPDMTIKERDDATWLPEEWDMSQMQNLPEKVLDEKYITYEFGQKCAMTFLVTIGVLMGENPGTFISHRSEGVVSEEQGRIYAGLHTVMKDIINGIQEIWSIMYPKQDEVIVIPQMRAQVTTEKLYEFEERGILSKEKCRELILYMCGINKDEPEGKNFYLDEEESKGKNKRFKKDDEDGTEKDNNEKDNKSSKKRKKQEEDEGKTEKDQVKRKKKKKAKKLQSE